MLASETMHRANTLICLLFMAAALPAWHTEVGFLKRTTCTYPELFGALTFWDASHVSWRCPHHWGLLLLLSTNLGLKCCLRKRTVKLTAGCRAAPCPWAKTTGYS